MMLPTPPMTHLIVCQTRFALASLETFFNAMFGFGHPGTFPQGCLRHRIGQIIVNLHHLLLVAVTGAYHHQRLLITWLTPMGSGDHPALHGLNPQGTFTAIAHVDPLPGCLTKRLTPGRDALPGTLAWASPAARRRGLCFQVTQCRVRRYRQQVTLTQRGKPTPKPIRTPHLVVTGNPAMGAARHRFWSTTPRPTGDACERLGMLWAHRLCPGGLYPSSILWAEKAAGPPGCGPFWRRIPSKWPLDSCRLCPDDHTTASPPLPTRAPTWQTPRDRTPAPHRLVPSAS